MSLEAGIDRWFALYVRPRHEKLVFRLLCARGVESWLPMNVWRHVYAHRSKENELKRAPILATPGVVSTVGAGKTPAPVDDNEIFSLHAAIKAKLSSEFGPFPQKGHRVRITKGALSGVEGILQVKNPLRLALSITLLQRSIQFELARSWPDWIHLSNGCPAHGQSGRRQYSTS